jgi:hypothetical protein
MRKLLEGLILIGVFVAANVVAAGVMLVLGQVIQAIAPACDSPWPWFMTGTAGVFAALVFLKGMLVYISEHSRIKYRGV